MLTTMETIWLILLASFQVTQSTPPDQTLSPSPSELPSDQTDQLLPNPPQHWQENLPQHRPCQLQNSCLNRPQHPPRTNSTFILKINLILNQHMILLKMMIKVRRILSLNFLLSSFHMNFESTSIFIRDQRIV